MQYRQIVFSAFLLIGIVVNFFQTSYAATEQGKVAHFLVLSDIHFDPFITCYNQKKKPCPLLQQLQAAPASSWHAILFSNDKSVSQYKQDTNEELLTSALTAAKKVADVNHAQFVLILGDFLGHDFRRFYKKYAQDRSYANYQAFVRKTLEFINLELAKTFPTIDVYSLVGNNDSYRYDYYAEPNGAFFRETGSLWSRLIKNAANRSSMQSEFSQGGYYSVVVPEQPNLRIILLNTVLFSNKAKGKQVDGAAAQELSWLHNELQLAKEAHQRVIIAMHIPTGIDVYATLRIRLFTLIELWHKSYIEQFKKELKAYAPEIMAIFAGHLHSDWFQILTFDHSVEVPISGIPAVSPIFGNNPGFKIFSYSTETMQLRDFVTYYYPLNDKRIWTTENVPNRLAVRGISV